MREALQKNQKDLVGKTGAFSQPLFDPSKAQTGPSKRQQMERIKAEVGALRKAD
jgi:hypothetical protein